MSKIEKYYIQAKEMIDKKDFTEFMSNISKAELLAEDNIDQIAQVYS